MNLHQSTTEQAVAFADAHTVTAVSAYRSSTGAEPDPRGAHAIAEAVALELLPERNELLDALIGSYQCMAAAVTPENEAAIGPALVRASAALFRAGYRDSLPHPARVPLPALLHSLQKMASLANEAITARQESEDAEDKEMLPVYEAEYQQAMALLAGALPLPRDLEPFARMALEAVEKELWPLESRMVTLDGNARAIYEDSPVYKGLVAKRDQIREALAAAKKLPTPSK